MSDDLKLSFTDLTEEEQICFEIMQMQGETNKDRMLARIAKSRKVCSTNDDRAIMFCYSEYYPEIQ